MSRIRYILSNDTEPDVRLSDAMLYAALSEALGDRIEPVDIMSLRYEEGVLWGCDPFHVLKTRAGKARAAYQESAVLEALEGKIVDYAEVQREMDQLRDAGYGATLRNMRNPNERLRHCARGDRFESHMTAIGAEKTGAPILVSKNRTLSFVRRFLIVAGSVAAESPYRYCSDTPTDLLDLNAWRLQAEDFMSPLTEEDPVWRDLQRAEVDRLLGAYPLASGAVDVGLDMTADSWVEAKIETVISAPPGAFHIFHADVKAYVGRVAEHLLELEPELAAPAEVTP